MRELRYVGPDEDPDALVVVAPDSGEQFRLPITPALRGTLGAPRSALPAAPPPPASPEPAVTQTSAPSSLEPPSVSPRDIQVRVRAGDAPEALAEEPGMTLDRVMRFARPVLEERQRVAGEAQRARARRNGSDSQTVLFGPAVEDRFRAAGVEPAHVRWDSRRRHDGQWIVIGTWDEDGEDRRAEWLLNLAHRSITALDETAADLLSDRPLRPLHPPVPESADTRGLAGVVQFPGMRTVPDPADEVFDQEALPPHPGTTDFDAGPTGTEAPVHRMGDSGPSAPSAPSSPRWAPAEPPAPTHEEPHLPLDFTPTTPLPADLGDASVTALGHRPADEDPGRHRADGSMEPQDVVPFTDDLLDGDDSVRPGSGVDQSIDADESTRPRRRSDKPKVPSWDDILLGVRRKSD